MQIIGQVTSQGYFDHDKGMCLFNEKDTQGYEEY
jgi:hypothetical protein